MLVAQWHKALLFPWRHILPHLMYCHYVRRSRCCSRRTAWGGGIARCWPSWGHALPSSPSSCPASCPTNASGTPQTSSASLTPCERSAPVLHFPYSCSVSAVERTLSVIFPLVPSPCACKLLHTLCRSLKCFMCHAEGENRSLLVWIRCMVVNWG